MAVLQLSNNQIHFTSTDGVSTASNHFDSAKVDYAMVVDDNATAGPIYPHDAPSGNTVWYSFDYFTSYTSISSEDGYIYNARDIDGNLLFRLDLVNGVINIVAVGSSETSVDTGVALSGGTLNKTAVKITVDTDVTVQFYLSGALLGTAVAPNANGFGVSRFFVFTLSDAIYNGDFKFSSLIVDDERRHDNGFFKLTPTSAGSDTDFTGDTYTALSDDDISTGMVGTSADDRASFNMEAYSGGAGINAYHVSAVLSAGSVGSFRFYLLIGGTRYYGATQTIDAGATRIASDQWALDPSDSSAWSAAKINAAQVGIEVVS